MISSQPRGWPHYTRVQEWKDLQDQEQHDDACDLQMPDRVCHGVTLWRPRVEEKGTVHKAILTWNRWCPVPEDAASDGEDDGGD